MTRLERLESRLEEMRKRQTELIRKQDLMGLTALKAKIGRLEGEIRDARMREPLRLSEVLKDKDESVKNGIYKSLLRISLLADVVNEATFECRELLNRYGLKDFNFSHKVDELHKLSQEIASVPLVAGSLMEDFIVDNGKFVDMCMRHADAHLKRKLKL